MHFGVTASEKILIASGIMLLIGVAVVSLGGSFSIWFVAKLLYALGVTLFVFNR